MRIQYPKLHLVRVVVLIIKTIKMNKSEYTFEEIWDEVMTIATEDEIRLVCNINGSNIKSLNSIIRARVGYQDLEQWSSMEGMPTICDRESIEVQLFTNRIKTYPDKH